MILRADYRLLKKQIMEKRDEITDKELFPLALMRIIRAGSLKVLPNDTGQVFML